MEMSVYQQYKEQSISTMTQEELLILLYDELIKRLTRADLAIGKEDFVLFDASIDRAIEIVRHLDDTLDRNYPISHDLHRLYDYFCYNLNRVKFGRNGEELGRVKVMVTELRDTFRTAALSALEGPAE